MSTEQFITVTYLSVSTVGLCVHSWARWKLRAAKAHMLIRTTTWRIVCSTLYVIVGVNALTQNWAPLQIALAAFCLTQGIWLTNSIVDKRLGSPPTTRRGFITITIGHHREEGPRPRP